MSGRSLIEVSAMQQMATMRHQMAMMQQQLVQQQIHLGGIHTSAPPGLVQVPMAIPVSAPAPVHSNGNAAVQLAAGTSCAHTQSVRSDPPTSCASNGAMAFEFMQNRHGDDAFNFVGDVMRGNKRSL